MNYYNEWDKGAAAWLRELIKAGQIPNGYVDERSITDVTAGDLEGFTQCHFFCGIGGWPLALQLAGVPSTQPLWTGSPPCQPFSVAGAGAGKRDIRHLAPAFLDLVAECRPQLIFGEQVAAAITKDQWADSLLIELAEEGYASGFTVLPACSVGAPHKRDRLFFGAVANGHHDRQQSGSWRVRSSESSGARFDIGRNSKAIELADTDSEQRDGCRGIGTRRRTESPNSCDNGGLADTNSQQQRSGGSRGARADDVPSGRQQDTATVTGFYSHSGMAHSGDRTKLFSESRSIERRLPQSTCKDAAVRASPHHGFWSDADWLGCRDGKFRPVEPSTFPLANGIPARVGRLRGYGNAIVPQVAAEFIKAFGGACEDR